VQLGKKEHRDLGSIKLCNVFSNNLDKNHMHKLFEVFFSLLISILAQLILASNLDCFINSKQSQICNFGFEQGPFSPFTLNELSQCYCMS
jgi:hypothetical protein